MSSHGHALQAVDLLQAAGHEDATTSSSHHGTGGARHVVSVSTDEPGSAYHVLRLVHAVDQGAVALDRPSDAPRPES